MRRIYFYITLILSTSILYSNDLDFTIGVSPKIGISSWSNSSQGYIGGLLGIETGISFSNLMITYQYYHYNEPPWFLPRFPEEFNYHNAILVGFFHDIEFLRYEFQVGYSRFQGLRRTDLLPDISVPDPVFDISTNNEYNSRKFDINGYLAQFGIKAVATDYIAFGFDLQINYNTEEIIYIGLLTFQVGKLR